MTKRGQLLPLSVRAVYALVYHRLSVWADLTFFLTWQVGVVERKITTPRHVYFLQLTKIYQNYLPYSGTSDYNIRVTCCFYGQKQKFRQPIWNTKLWPRHRSFSSRCPFSDPIRCYCNLILALKPSPLVKACLFPGLMSNKSNVFNSF